MYGSTSVRWIVHTITLKRTYERQSVEWRLRLLCILYPSILHAAVVAVLILILMQVGNFIVLRSHVFFTR